MKIAIDIGDNDFYNTFSHLMNTLLLSAKYSPEEFPRDKDNILFLINKLIVGHYFAFQNYFRYTHNQESLEQHDIHMTKYLSIDIKYLYLNEEVDKALEEGKFNNSSAHILEINFQDIERSYIYCL